MIIAAIIPYHLEPAEKVLRTAESAGSTDGVSEVVLVDDSGGKREPIRVPWARTVIAEKNGGPAAARNLGVRSTSAEYIATLDVGDVWYPEPKSRQLSYVRQHRPPACFSRCYDTIAGAERPVADNWQRMIFQRNSFQLSTTVVSKDAWLQVGGYREDLLWCSDWAFHFMVQGRVGWTFYDELTGTADEEPGGHSDLKSDKQRQRAWRQKSDIATEISRAIRAGEWQWPT